MMFSIFKRTAPIALTSLVVMVFALPALAACTGISCVTGGLDVTAGEAGVQTSEKNLGVLIGSAINYLFGLMGVIFMVVILIGGYLWMTAGGSEEKVGKAKQFIANGINGMIVIFLAYALVYAILFSLATATGSAT